MKIRVFPRRTALACAIALLATEAFAQGASRPQGAAALAEPPPPPQITEADAMLQPQVTVRTEGEQTVQEYRVRGKLFMVRVTPRNGPSYVLMDHKGDGTFSKQDNTLDQGVRVPQWVLLEF